MAKTSDLLDSPQLFEVGPVIETTTGPRANMYGVVGYWPKGGWWTVFDKWWVEGISYETLAANEAAERYAKNKASMGWLKCRVLCLQGERE